MKDLFTAEEIKWFQSCSQEAEVIIPTCFDLVSSWNPSGQSKWVQDPPTLVQDTPLKEKTLKNSIDLSVSILEASSPSSLKSGKGHSFLSPLKTLPVVSPDPLSTPQRKTKRN